jgi:hypothetical protein
MGKYLGFVNLKITEQPMCISTENTNTNTIKPGQTLNSDELAEILADSYN